MTQDVPKDVQVETKPETAKELDTKEAEAVAGGDLSCALTNIGDITGQLVTAYENTVDAASHVIERVITATKAS
jgi:hypothetical protein